MVRGSNLQLPEGPQVNELGFGRHQPHLFSLLAGHVLSSGGEKTHSPPPQWLIVKGAPERSRALPAWRADPVLIGAQALISDVLRDMLNHFVFVYLDDIQIFLKSVE